MFGIGTPELILIIIIALLVIGPRELPKIGRDLGKAFRSFQRAADDVKESIAQGIEDAGKGVDHALNKEQKDEEEHYVKKRGADL